MVIEPAALTTITAAVSVLGNECLKGIASEAGKTAWKAVKSLFGWTSDPVPAEIPKKVTEALTASPALMEQLLQVLKGGDATTAALVGNLQVHDGGKVVVAQIVHTLNM